MNDLSRILIPTTLLFFTPQHADAQCSVTSSTGYTVNMKVQPVQVQPTTTSCPYGYNYTTRLAYDITYSGTNFPASLNTLQGTVTCNGTSQFFDLPNGTGNGQTVSANTYTGMTNCATANPVTMNCNTVRIEIQGPGIPSRVITCPTTPVVLPISLLEFTAEVQGTTVELHWATASESDNAYFTVERSTDTKEFHPVSIVPGAVNSQSTLYYVANDPEPLDGTSYYRLKQTDTDGSSTYSEVLAVENSLGAKDLVISPNPARDDLFRIMGNVDGCSLEVRSLTGALMFELPVANEMVSHPPLPKGMYLVYLIPKDTGAGKVVRMMQD